MTKKTVKKELSIKEMSQLYDRIYNIADRLLKKHNPCNIHVTKKGKLKCRDISLTTNKLCCISCETYGKTTSKYNDKYWSVKGCTVKCLACKLFLCSAIRNQPLRKRFRRLRRITERYLIFKYIDTNGDKRIITTAYKYFYSKEDWLKLLKQACKQSNYER